MAVGALHANRNNVERASIKEKVAAMRSYHMSMVALQECLGDKNVVQRDDVLWATFFLGVFELLSDHSGEGWVKHMLYGTSKMLQLVGPSGCKSSLRRVFYDLFRVLEASRSLLYNEETILSQKCWLQLHACSGSDMITRWEPMGEITILMIQTSAFSLRARSLVESVPESDRYMDASITILATEGLEIQATIYNWHTEALLHLSQGRFDGYINLSLLYYHALLIFLSGNFDYFPYWNNIPAPVLCPMDVSDHLGAILELAEQILSQCKIPGAMLFFPLTVAGSRARDPAQRSQIVSLLDRVFRTGFVVANRVKVGILDRWVKRDEVLLPDPLVDTIEVEAEVVSSFGIQPGSLDTSQLRGAEPLKRHSTSRLVNLAVIWRPEFLDIFLDFSPETKLLAEAKGIRDELRMLCAALLHSQSLVLARLKPRLLEAHPDRLTPETVARQFDEQDTWIEVYLRDIHRISRQAVHVYDSAASLLDLKQKHANPFEARLAREQAAQTSRCLDALYGPYLDNVHYSTGFSRDKTTSSQSRLMSLGIILRSGGGIGRQGLTIFRERANQRKTDKYWGGTTSLRPTFSNRGREAGIAEFDDEEKARSYGNAPLDVSIQTGGEGDLDRYSQVRLGGTRGDTGARKVLDEDVTILH
ncbi:hypothetical protein BJY01DRAFT_255186 [Aspergillus pseudoustus]|uniref:Uncharacterized protein n=1 Tax=Aspergillus pseudoustus TaxID=1810923 RepID=A0ABR4IMT2_9EURO